MPVLLELVRCDKKLNESELTVENCWFQHPLQSLTSKLVPASKNPPVTSMHLLASEVDVLDDR